MTGLYLDHRWAFTFGILGNIISFMVYLAPLPTFHRVYRNGSTENFQSIPYVVALFSAMLWIYYALVKTDAYLLITINTIGCIIETIYIVIYLKYAPRSAKIFTCKILLLLNVGMFGLILVLTLLLSSGSDRVRILGWICVGFSVSVYVAPLSIIRLVIRTRSVEFMPIFLSFFLTLSAVVWFFYGYLKKNKFVAIPNILGFAIGLAQMVLYFIYKDRNKVIAESKCADDILTVVKIGATPGLEVPPIKATVQDPGNDHTRGDDLKAHEPIDGGEKESLEAQDEIDMGHIV